MKGSMIHIDYFYDPVEGDDSVCDKSPMLTEDTLIKGWEVWIDGVNGVDFISFLLDRAVDSQLNLVIPTTDKDDPDITDLENSYYVEAVILENLEYCARVRLLFVDRFGHWVRTVPLFGEFCSNYVPKTVLADANRMVQSLSLGRTINNSISGTGYPQYSEGELNNTYRLQGPSGEEYWFRFILFPNETRCLVSTPERGLILCKL